MLLSEGQSLHVGPPSLVEECLPPQNSREGVQPQHSLGVGQRVQFPGGTDYTFAVKLIIVKFMQISVEIVQLDMV